MVVSRAEEQQKHFVNTVQHRWTKQSFQKVNMNKNDNSQGPLHYV